MDPRHQRTRAKLAKTIIRLATEQPTSTLTVSTVAREAQISRDTFYRHASTPQELLASVLDEQLQDIHIDDGTDRNAVLAAEQALLTHIAQHAAIYRNALVVGTEASVRAILVGRITATLTDYANGHPSILPVSKDAAGPAIRDFAVAYAAHGTVGAIEEWLRSTDPVTPATAANAIVSVSPKWWLDES